MSIIGSSFLIVHANRIFPQLTEMTGETGELWPPDVTG